MATRAVAAATQQVIEALAAFAQQRQATIIPMLQRQLVETFVDREPGEIAKLLGREIARERMFLKRQASRMKRDLPGVLAEADIEARRAAMQKLLDREKRYMGQRERAMTARAHSVVESLRLEEASPEGAFWRLGGAIHHTAGCIAMSGKFWPWEVLREVAIPPVHPGCACQLVGLHEAAAYGLAIPRHLPDVKDAIARAKRYMALEEAFEDAEPEPAVRAEILDAYLEEAQRRYAKGLAHGGEFMPSVGGDFTGAKGALRKLLPHGLTKRGESRHVWIKGHQVHVSEDSALSRKIGGDKFTSPAGSTSVYRNGHLVSVDGEPPTHPDLMPPTSAPAGKLEVPGAAPDSIAGAESAARVAARTAIEKRIAASPKNPPVSVGMDAKTTHDALLDAGFKAGKSKGSKTSLVVAYSRDGNELGLEYGRTSGKVEEVRWLPSTKAPKASKPGKGSGGAPAWSKGGDWHTGASLFASPGPPPSPYKPIPPTEHPALISEPAAPGPVANFDHVPLTVKAHSTEATGPGGEKFRFQQGEQDHVASQLLANSLYRAVGVPVPAMGVRHTEEPDFASIPDVSLGEGPIEAGSKRTSSGIILRHPNGDVTVFEPRNHFGGYEHTFPKGGVEEGLTPQQNAHKELWEETGLHARITGVVGDYHGTTSVSRYYTGVMTGGTPTTGPETESVKTVSPEEAAKLLNTQRDQEILADLLANHPLPEQAGMRVRQHEGVVGDRSHNTRNEDGRLPIAAVATMPGKAGEVPGEHRNRKGPEWDAFVDDIRKNGVRRPIFITVDHGEDPKISEGNHRRDAAIEAGLTHVPVEIKYFGKAEDAGTVEQRAGVKGLEPDTFPETVLKPAILSPSVGGKNVTVKKPSAELGQHYMADALLANWDVVGSNDGNLRAHAEHGIVRLDQSGTLGYRPSGEPKPFGPIPTEVWTLRSVKGQHFGKVDVSEDERRAQAGKLVAALPPEKVDALVDAAPFASQEKRDAVRTALKMRLGWMRAYAKGDVSEPETLQGPAAAAELTASQEGMELFPEQHAAIALYPHEMAAIDALLSDPKIKPSDDQKLIMKELDSALRYSRTDEDVIAYTGIDPAALGENPVGRTLSSKGYLGMTLSEGQARLEPAVIQVTLPGGSHAIYTRGIPGVDAAEVDDRTPDVIGQRGARLRIVEQRERDGKTYFEAVLLP